MPTLYHERRAAVAGLFYPARREALEAAIDRYLGEARAPHGGPPIALIAPHAGYEYCGRILAEAWTQAARHRYERIVLLGTNHTASGLDRVAVWANGPWRTPLGAAPVDGETAAAVLAAAPTQCSDEPAPHLQEHSIEIHVPFAQRLFPGTPLLPVVVGTDQPESCGQFGRVLAEVVRSRRALIVASSDLSHYPARSEATRVDRRTLAAIAELDAPSLVRTLAAELARGTPGLVTCACGEAPILVAVSAALSLGATRGRVLAYANSGDVAGGDARRVVGYGAVAFTA